MWTKRIHTSCARPRVLCLLATVTLTGCYGVAAPPDHVGYTRGETVVLSGYSLFPNRTVVGVVSPTSSGGGALYSGRIEFSGLTGAAPVGTFRSGRPYYAWTMRNVLPSSAWVRTIDAGCEVDEAYIMVGEPRPGAGSVTELETPYIGDPSSLTTAQTECLEAELDAGEMLNEALLTCRVFPVPQRIVASNRFHGDAVIASVDDLAALRCFDEIDGSLIVLSDFISSSSPGTGFDVSLPRLKRVTGNVFLTYNMRAAASTFPPDTRCGGVSPALSRRINLPVLTQIGGSLRINVPGTSPSRADFVELGLNALQKVGRDVDFDFAIGPQPCGLNALASVPGRLRFSWRLDVAPQRGNFLSSLRSVGSLEVQSGDTISSRSELLATLESAGSVRIHQVGNWRNPLPALQRVRGDFAIVGSELSGEIAPQLMTITGLLSVSGSRTSPLSLGGRSLTAGGLSVTENQFACIVQPVAPALLCPAVSAIPLRLRATGTLRVVGNGSLPAGQVCGLRDLVEERGFSGLTDLGSTLCP